MASVIDSIVKQAGDTKKSMDWYRGKVRDATGSGTTARGLIRQGKASSRPKFGIMNLFEPIIVLPILESLLFVLNVSTL